MNTFFSEHRMSFHFISFLKLEGCKICGVIKGSCRSLKAIDKIVFINFGDKNALFTKSISITQKDGIIIFPKKDVNYDKFNFATKQRMFWVFAIDEILRYR